MRSGKYLLAIVGIGLMAGCGNVVVDHETEGDGVTLGESQSRWSFEMPGDGTPNENGWVGPFCCTGETAVVTSDDGSEIGYAYFFNWKGNAYLTGPDSSAATDLQILVAGSTDPANPKAELEEGDVDFLAEEMVAGASREVQAGVLKFTVTIEHADVLEDPVTPLFDMGTIAVRVDVDPVTVP